MKGYLRSFQRIVRLYRDSTLQRDEMKDDIAKNLISQEKQALQRT